MKKKVALLVLGALMLVPIMAFAQPSETKHCTNDANCCASIFSDAVEYNSIAEIVATHLDATGHNSAEILDRVYQLYADGHNLEEIQDYIHQAHSIEFDIEILTALTSGSYASPHLLLCIISHDWLPWGSWQHLTTHHGMYGPCRTHAACVRFEIRHRYCDRWLCNARQADDRRGLITCW